MSLPALNVSIGSAKPPAEHSHNLGGKSAGGSHFAALVSALAGEITQTNAQGAATKGAASAQDSPSPSESAPNANDSQSIDAGLAGLVYSAIASPIGAALSQIVPTNANAAAGPNSAAAKGAATASGALSRAWAGPGVDANAVLTAGDPATAALASIAGDGAVANVPLSSVADAPQAIQIAANGAPSLGLGAVQSRTYLAVDNAAQSEAKNPIARAQARSATQAAVAQSSPTEVPVAESAVTASTGNQTPTDKRSSSRHGDSQSASSDPAAQSGPPAVGAAASPGVGGVAANPTTAAAGPIPLSQLADRLATEASALTSQAAASDSAPAKGVTSASAVKELKIDLDPAGLGAVSVKMRMAEGKLSVVMEVASPSTLKAIEGERDTIVERLGSTAQPLETLIIKPAAASQANTESDNAQDQKSAGRENAQNDPSGNSQGNGQQSSRRDGAAGQRYAQAAARQPASVRGFGDLLV